MKKNYQLSLKHFGFTKEFLNEETEIACSAIQYNCMLWMTTKEHIRNTEFKYEVEVSTLALIKNKLAPSGFMAKQRLAIVNCSLIENISTQLTELVKQANKYANSNSTTNHSPNTFATAYIQRYFRSTSRNDLNFCTGDYYRFNEDESLSIEKIQFCGDKPWELNCTNGVERYLLSNGYISFCSWQFAEGHSINDPYNFNVTIIFKAYDHSRNQFFELNINACSIQWLEQESKNIPILFMRYIMVMDRFNAKYISEYIFYTIQAIAYHDPAYKNYDIATLSLGYQLSAEYLQYAEESGEPYAYY